MASIQRMDAALGMFVDKKFRDVHTGLRARVLDVDYSIPSATLQPLPSTTFDDGTTDAYPPIYDVPLQMVSGNGGKSRLTVPVKPGDIVGLQFSERNENDTTDKSTHGLNPGWAITSVHSDGNAQPIDPDNVELWNDKVHFTMTPEGDFTLTGPVGTFKVDKTGEMEFTNGKATIQATPEGEITLTTPAATIKEDPSGNIFLSNATANVKLDAGGEITLSSGAANLAVQVDGNIAMNGAKVTPDGNFITATGVNMNDFFSYFQRHVHHYTWTDGSGQSNTAPPGP